MTKLMIKRDKSIDAIKGVGILCITLLHFEAGIFPDWLNIWIGLFMVNTFYFTAGWLMSMKPTVPFPKELMKRRICQLGIPYVWFSIIILCFNLVWWLLEQIPFSIILRDAYKAIVFCGIGTLWFLPALLGSEWLFCFIQHTRRIFLSALLLFIVSAVCCWLYQKHWLPVREQNDIYRMIDAPMRPFIRSLQGWLIVYLGFLAGKYLSKALHGLNSLSLVGIGMLCILVSLVLLLPGFPNLSYLGKWLSNTLPELGLLCIFMAFPRGFHVDFFAYWGKNSLILMCTHYSITEEILKTIDKCFFPNQDFCGWRTLTYFVIAIGVTYPIVRLINNKFYFILGKKKM